MLLVGLSWAQLGLERFIQEGGDDETVTERCKRHLKEPSCVVGEHRHCPLANDAVPLPLPLSLSAETETVSFLCT